MFKVYRFLSSVLSPLLYFFLKYRLRRAKEDPLRFHEKLGHTDYPRLEGKLIWIHAVSVGESLSALTLIDKILNDNPLIQILVTTGTKTSAKLMVERLPKGAFHQYFPFDTPQITERFLNYWQPEAVFWLESEIWPNIWEALAQRQTPLILLNARLSQKSFEWWQFLKSLLGPCKKAVTKCLASTAQDAERFKKLGFKNVTTFGNLKNAANPLPYNEPEYQRLKNLFKGRKVWCAASTHEGEEEIILKVHRRLKEDFPNLLTILVPRHPGRGEELTNQIANDDFLVSRRSTETKFAGNTEVYLADTLGELGLFYRLSPIVFVGGSLVKRGGHNILEPAQLGCAILHGLHMQNFSEMQTLFASKLATIRVENDSELYFHVRDLLGHDMECKRLAEIAEVVAKDQRAVLENVYQELEHYISEKGERRVGYS